MAEAARDMGAEVTVVAASTTVPAPKGVRVVNVRTSEEMSQALKQHFVDSDVLVMAAAVSDFKPSAPLTEKKKTTDKWSLDLERTEDILAGLGKIKGNRMIIGFALETQNIEANALDKLARKNCDLIVVNNPHTDGAAFSHLTNVVQIYNAQGKLYESAEPESKRTLARRILTLAANEAAFSTVKS